MNVGIKPLEGDTLTSDIPIPSEHLSNPNELLVIHF